VTRVEQAEAIFRAVVVSFGGKPDHWQHSVEMIQRGLRAASHLLPPTTAELVEMLTGDFGAGPSDPDPGF
jgi:hypothetical protein